MLGSAFFSPSGALSHLSGKWCPSVFHEKNLRIVKHIGNAGSIITSALRVASSPSARPVAARAWRCWLACGPASGLLAAQHPQRSASKGAAAALGLGVGARGGGLALWRHSVKKNAGNGKLKLPQAGRFFRQFGPLSDHKNFCDR